MLDSHCMAGRSHWYVVRTHQGQESRVELNLNAGAIETFLPCVRTASRRRLPPQREALFPQYLFARFEPAASLHDVTFTRGVHSVVRVGGQLATVDEGVIVFFRSQVDQHGLIPLGRKLQPGEPVTIQHGPFSDLAGIVERSLPARHRVVVLLGSLGGQMRVEVPADHLGTCGVSVASDSIRRRQ